MQSRNPSSGNITRRYAIYGALFGLAFPVMGTLIRLFTHEGSITLGTIPGLHFRDPLMLIIDTAPLVLGGFAYFIGRSRTRIETLLEDVRSQAASFERFYPRQFVTLMGKKTVHEVSAGAHAPRDMTILFSDIRGYTAMSESMDSGELFEIMRDYFEWVSPIFIQHGGFIDKYIGDSIMAIFPGSPEDAVRAAGDLIHHLRSYNEMVGEMNRPSMRIGVGIHFGALSIGTVGAGNRLSTTVMGDVVNLAARIEGLTRKFHIPVIITDEVYKKLSEDVRDETREIAIARVKGRSSQITLYEYFGGETAGLRGGKKKTRADFLRALYLHRGGEHAEALSIFEGIHVASPEDPVPVLYIEQCKKHESRQASNTKFLRLLIIDDNPAISDLIRAFLKGRPYRILTAETGEAGRKLFESETPELVFVDFNLPDTDGVTLLKSLRPAAMNGLSTKFIALTAEETSGYDFEAAGAVGFLQKPITKASLFETLETHS